MHTIRENLIGQCLVLLFFFLVLGDVCQVQAQQNTQIGILRDGSFTLNGAPHTSMSLKQQLMQMFANRARRVVYLNGDPATEFRHVARAIDIARASGIDITQVKTPLQKVDVPVSLVTTEHPSATTLSMVKAENPSLAPDADRDDTLVVLITQTGDAYLGTLLLKPDEFVPVIKKALTPRRDPLAPPAPPPPPGQPTIAYIKADSRAPYGRVLEVMDRLAAAGVNKVNFLSVITGAQ